ncbi:DMT family transporter [Marinomonas sp. 15G1-11]|mgnify:CR=1 FL=1|uniref:DMT family transporter n=1 Tax=Marinomonas phaeophyticola TaxID=3004091 RepID=A0ABT4JSL4_9GAMM|nr:DMT family transporter [Marinomonas sp. 15G1-11]MCZ2721325.1 DMT family transporter [Marinomonas sp. 15G1-11]
MSDQGGDALVVEAPAYRRMATGSDLQLGIAAAFITIMIWASWLISVKMGVASSLTTFDLALMRYAAPALIFLPFLYRSWEKVRTVPKRILAGMVFGAGLPFFFLSSAGMHHAPVAHAGLLIPGTFPLFVTAIAVLVYKEALSKQRFIGLALIATGVCALVGLSFFNGNQDIWKGDLYFLAASFCWAVFTICLRVAGLPPLAATAILGLVSTVLLLLLYTLGVLESGMRLASIETLTGQFIVQAILVGLLTGFTYGFAINRIGAESTAAIGSLTPVMATLAAIPLLSESITMASALGIVLICLGVFCASGVKLPRKK